MIKGCFVLEHDELRINLAAQLKTDGDLRKRGLANGFVATDNQAFSMRSTNADPTFGKTA